jgi:hypothetical protein
MAEAERLLAHCSLFIVHYAYDLVEWMHSWGWLMGLADGAG